MGSHHRPYGDPAVFFSGTYPSAGLRSLLDEVLGRVGGARPDGAPVCELWDIDKGRDPFDMSNWWRGEVWRSERETAAMTLTRTKAGEVPHGTFDFEFHAHP